MSTPSMLCLCGIHVHNPGAFIISIIGIIGNVLIGGYCTLIHSYILLIMSLLAFVACICLLIGNYTENPLLYWPYFILMPVVILVELIFSLLSFTVVAGTMGLLPDFLAQTQMAQQLVGLYPVLFHPIGLFAAIFALILVIFLSLEAYFFYVLLKAYGFLKFSLANQTFDSEWKPRIYV